MNVKVTIEVDGAQEDVERWLSRFALAQGGAAPIEWTPELAEKLVRRISDRARAALAYMADEAPVVSFEDLQSELEVSGVELGGILASFGFAERAGLPRPYEVDHERREYRMDPAVATIINNAIIDWADSR
jgi:hypothetical protein